MIIEHPSPNYEPRREGPIDILLIHYTGMTSTTAALERLSDPVTKLSSHYLIDEAGTVYQLVDEASRAYHAGVSYWAGILDINSRSIGIELANPGHDWGYHDFPAAQMGALLFLSQAILARHPIPPHRVLGHSDVAPDRKQDPGERFDWRWLADHGIGLWPDLSGPVTLLEPQAGLARIGYDVDGKELSTLTRAFQRHWRQSRVDGLIDAETADRIARVAALIPGII